MTGMEIITALQLASAIIERLEQWGQVTKADLEELSRQADRAIDAIAPGTQEDETPD